MRAKFLIEKMSPFFLLISWLFCIVCFEEPVDLDVLAVAAAADVDAVAAAEVDDVRDCLNREKNDVVSNIE